VILTNPPFGSKEGKDAQKHFAFPTSSTQVLFVQDILGELSPDGRCAIVLDDKNRHYVRATACPSSNILRAILGVAPEVRQPVKTLVTAR
jgi:hypothetical protein